MPFRVIIHTGYDYPAYHAVMEEVREYLIKNGLQCDNILMTNEILPEHTIRDSQGYNAALASHEMWNEAVYQELAADLRVVSKLGIGVDTIDVPAATKMGIAVTNTPGANASAVSDMAVTLMLALNRKLHIFDSKIKAGDWWTAYLGGQMEGSTVGLVGFGTISQITARYLGGFGCRILTYDPYFNPEIGKKYNVTSVSLEELAKESDFISVHVPLTKDTRGILNKEFFNIMKPTAFFVNTSRGPVVNESDLIEALLANKIAGAGLDVFETEPLSKDSPLRKMDNVILTAHVAGNSLPAVRAVGRIAADNVIAIAQGKLPKYVVNPDFENYSTVKYGR